MELSSSSFREVKRFDTELGIYKENNVEFEDLKRKLNIAVCEFKKGISEIKKHRPLEKKRKSVGFSEFMK